MFSKALDKFEKIDAGAKSAMLFFLLLLIGAIYILTAKFGGARAGLVTFVPVALMMGYALALGFIRSFRLRDDQAGDNLYYMGFLFTLISLGVSLYQFSAEGAAETIVQNFGVAVASTIAGVALRILFTQMRRDPVDVERTARLELAEAARRMRRELDNTVMEMNHFRRATQQAMNEGFEAIRENVERISAGLLLSVEEVAKKSTAPIQRVSTESGFAVEELTKRIVGAIEDSAAKLGRETDRLSDGSAAVTTSLGSVALRLAEMRTPDSVIEVNLAPVTRQFADTTTRLSEAVAASNAASKTALESANADRARNDKSLIDCIEKLESASAESTGQLHAALRVFEIQVEQNKLLGGVVGQVVQRIDREFERQSAREDAQQQLAGMHQNEIRQGFDLIVQAVNRVGQRVETSSTSLVLPTAANAVSTDDPQSHAA